MNAPTPDLPLYKAPHAALQDALFVYAVGTDGAGADLIRGWPALVERVVADVAGGPWDELLCDLYDWSLDGDDIPFHYSVNFEDGYMAIYRVHDERDADRAAGRALEAVPDVSPLTDELVERAASAIDKLDRRPDFLAGVRFAETFYRNRAASPAAAQGVDQPQMPPEFLDYVKRNYSGEVIFHDPLWHAVRLWRAAMHASKPRGLASPAASPVPRDWESVCDECCGTGKVDVSEVLTVDGRYMGENLMREVCNNCDGHGLTICIADIPKGIQR